jgi:molecular chaperone HtpG
MSTHQLNIETENILPIIKRWLYSEKDIFLRELVSNACDAIKKLELIAHNEGLKIDAKSFKIEIKIDNENKTIQVIDNGIGMTQEEVQKYIANIAFSGASEFLKKYETKKRQDQIIGHFGLGFYSAYMVSKKVTIDTLSYLDNSTPALWECDGSSSYTLDKGTRTMRGTTITLHLEDAEHEYLDENRIVTLLKRYCLFLPYPLYVNEVHINPEEPLWLAPKSKIDSKKANHFYSLLYPMQPEPILWIHLNVDYPFRLKGVIYFPKLKKDFDFNKNTIKLFCNRIFVSDNCKDLLPDYLMVLQGAIDSPDIPLNVSRSYLQMDQHVRQIGQHISKKIADELTHLYNNEFETFCKHWPDFETILKMGAIQDEKFFKRTEELFIWKTTDEKWVGLKECLKEGQKTIYYAFEDTNKDLIELYRQKNIDVLIAHPFLDTHFFGALEKGGKYNFSRIDSKLDEQLLGNDTQEDAEKEGLITKLLDEKDLTVKLKHFAKESLIGFIQFDENMRRFRDMMQFQSGEKSPFPEQKTFFVNTAHPLVKQFATLHQKDPHLAQELIQVLYKQSLLNQKELDPKTFSNFLEKSQKLIVDLCQKLL